jgi:hypothetical protein
MMDFSTMISRGDAESAENAESVSLLKAFHEG